MTTSFDEFLHPRATDGRFSAKERAEAGVTLTATDPDYPPTAPVRPHGTPAPGADEIADQLVGELNAVRAEIAATRAARIRVEDEHRPVLRAANARFRDLQAAELEVSAATEHAEYAVEDLYEAHGARLARHYAADVASTADQRGWKLKVRRTGADVEATRAAAAAAASDPGLAEAVARWESARAARDAAQAGYDEISAEVTAANQAVQAAAGASMRAIDAEHDAWHALANHEAIREAGLTGEYTLADPGQLTRVHLSEEGTNVWARRHDGWVRVQSVARQDAPGYSSVKFVYANGEADEVMTHYAQGEFRRRGPVEVAVATPEPGSAMITGRFIGHMDSTG